MSTETPTRRTGGSFLIEEVPVDEVFTPEDFSEEAQLLGQTTREFIANEVEPLLDRLESMEEGLLPSLLKKAGEIGLLATDVPEAYGGLDVPKTATMYLVESLARGGSFNVGHGAHTGIGTLPIVYYGTQAQKDEWLPKLATGECLGAYALTEQSSGSDALAARCTAVLDGDEWVLNGEKMFITNAGFADLFTVFAKVDGKDFTAFLVPATAPGVSTGAEEHKMGIKGSSTRALVLQDARIPKANLLGEQGKGHHIAFNILNVGRFKLGAGAVGGSKLSLDTALAYAIEREQFGKPLTAFPLIQGKLADMTALTFASESALYRTAGLLDEAIARVDKSAEGGDRKTIEAIGEHSIECSIIKVLASEVLDFCVDECVQIFGGYGFVSDYPAERFYRDARINRLYEGTNEINRMVIVGMLLKAATKGTLPLFAAAKAVQADVLSVSGLGETLPREDYADASDMVARAKKAILLVAGVAALKYGPKLEQEQEVLAWVADMVIETFATESAVLRARKLQAAGKDSPMFRAMVDVLMVRLNQQLLAKGTEALSHMSEGDDLRMQLSGMKRFTKLADPIDSATARRTIAKLLVAAGKYEMSA
jgi:alkylation response protein AidB-like acyl-CoA dehydrogenase